MSTYLYFGENEFFLTRAIKQLKTHTLDQQWANFNYTEYPPESKETIPQALSDIMTPPVGNGGRFFPQENSTILKPRQIKQRQLPHRNITLTTAMITKMTFWT